MALIELAREVVIGLHGGDLAVSNKKFTMSKVVKLTDFVGHFGFLLLKLAALVFNCYNFIYP